MRIVLVAVLGAAGASARYGIGVAVGVQSFPWATLAINVAGSFLLGLVLVAGVDRLSADALVGVSVGFLGAFTTFSTFGYETQTLLRTDRAGAAATYVVASVALGVAAAALGYTAGRAVASGDYVTSKHQSTVRLSARPSAMGQTIARTQLRPGSHDSIDLALAGGEEHLVQRGLAHELLVGHLDAVDDEHAGEAVAEVDPDLDLLQRFGIGRGEELLDDLAERVVVRITGGRVDLVARDEDLAWIGPSEHRVAVGVDLARRARWRTRRPRRRPAPRG